MVYAAASLARRYWWLLLVRGILTVAFGILVVAWPRATATVIILVFGIFAILNGLTAILSGIAGRRQDADWGWTVFLGALSLIAGIVALVWPRPTGLVVLFFIAVWAIAVGVLAIAGAFQAKALRTPNWAWVLVGGILTVIFGILLIVWPVSGVLTILWLVAVWAIIDGIVLSVASFQLRSASRAVLGET